MKNWNIFLIITANIPRIIMLVSGRKIAVTATKIFPKIIGKIKTEMYPYNIEDRIVPKIATVKPAAGPNFMVHKIIPRVRISISIGN